MTGPRHVSECVAEWLTQYAEQHQDETPPTKESTDA